MSPVLVPSVQGLIYGIHLDRALADGRTFQAIRRTDDCGRRRRQNRSAIDPSFVEVAHIRGHPSTSGPSDRPNMPVLRYHLVSVVMAQPAR
jgi:hypothetical protein